MVRIIAVTCCLALLGTPARASAQPPVASLTLAEAVGLASTANPTVRAKEFEVQAVGANEITAALRPNPATFFHIFVDARVRTGDLSTHARRKSQSS